MGTTASGIRYPEPTEPVAQGAAAMKILADDVQAKYQLAPVNSGHLNDWGGAMPAGRVAQVVAGTATITMASNGQAAWNVPGNPWAGILSAHFIQASNVGIAGDVVFSVAQGGSRSTLIIGAKNGGVLYVGVLNFSFIVVAYK